tara:strand:+ start:279 stop:557 length:279 start_codon:yes stop_codon:yes gene_type:complete
MIKRTNQGMMEEDLYGTYKGHKYTRRRKILKQGQSPLVQFGRKWKKASTLAKVGIGAAALAPKAILIGVGYLGAKSGAKKNGKEQPKKYMAG